jgi:hypothetical protein
MNIDTYHDGQAAMVARLCGLTMTSGGAACYRFTGPGVDVVARAGGHGNWSATTGGVAVESVEGIHSLRLALAAMVTR